MYVAIDDEAKGKTILELLAPKIIHISSDPMHLLSMYSKDDPSFQDLANCLKVPSKSRESHL